MIVFDKPIDQLAKSDITSLVERDVREGLTLDYKAALNLDVPDSEKRDLLADVASFGNAAGGYIVFGIADKREQGKATGRPEKIVGLPGMNVGAERLRLENLIRDGIEPRIPGVRTHEIDMRPEHDPVLVVHVPRSFNAPHMVKLRVESRFYSRNSLGKYPLDVRQIRAAFVSSEALPERIRGFRSDRLAKVVAGDTPVKLAELPKVVLHVVPLAPFDVGVAQGLDLVGLLHDSSKWLRLLSGGSNDRRYNLDGFLWSHNAGREHGSRGYTQLWRSGAIETIDAYFVRESREYGKLIYGYKVEDGVRQALGNFLTQLKDFSVEPPILVMLSLLGVKGYRVVTDNVQSLDIGAPVDRDALIIPDVVVQSFEQDRRPALRPMFDALWQSAGWEGSPSYDEHGQWRREDR